MNDLVRGCGVALVTPFSEGEINYDTLGKLVDMHVELSGSIIAAGTTSEAATMTDEEYHQVIKFVIERANKHIPVIAGAGSNCTAAAIEKSRFCEKAGADGLLIVTPYYNKTTQRGLINHYKMIAESTSLPIIVYNVPGRTGMNIEPKTVLELSKIKNIVGIKEASGNISQVAEIIRICPKDFLVYSGNDDMVVPLMSLGGKGVISVVANILPAETKKIVDDFNSGNFEAARDAQLAMNGLINSLFIETNPIPVKEAMGILNMCSPEVREPLYPMSTENREKLIEEMNNYGIGLAGNVSK
ncbi:MAG: 4-hydroxy-tetrahydrodipicolinate synthase [Sedimentibacter sp.]|uniref:4-hydroxy-tetrahydrodipicolinate synthase n=1 Tax=Sedimentibacter sp. TaxID=1960295 RepID=UPI0029827486|nr:4-hydroxy-tetrahydrodipicolinate synthase [Sedimentibacter sp.]MDW5298875.1 4-hydroxy-tetrahydrodipicolinate synthase [Sedimentibacter sp.]